MYRGLIVALAVFLPSILIAEPTVPARVQVGLEHIRETDLHADIAFLASDAMKGRLAMEQGDDVAVQWVVSEFAKAGLEPVATDAQGKASFLQPVPLIAYSPDSGATRLSLERNGKRVEWKRPDISARFPADLDVHAPVVFAGYGITDPGLHYDDYANVDAKGKIVVVFTGEPQENDPKSIFNGNGNTRNAAARVKLLTAQAHGAVALLIAPVPVGSALSPMERSARYANADKDKPHPEHAAFALADDSIRIPSMLISSQVMTQLLAGSGNTPAQLQVAIDRNLEPASRALSGTASLDFASHVEKKGLTWNVAGLLPGSDPELAAETIIVSGHHDHHGENKDGAIFHGADDNASGTAGVVALAHAFMANTAKPKRSILFVVFGAEEPGLLGSYYMADHPLRPLATTRAVINFDMIGRDEKPSIQTGGIMEVPADTSNRLNLIGSVYSPEYLRTVGEQNDAHVGLVLDDRFDHDAATTCCSVPTNFPLS